MWLKKKQSKIKKKLNLSSRGLGFLLGFSIGRLEDLLALLLSLQESILEEIGIWGKNEISICGAISGKASHVLSELAKRIAKVTASGSPSLTSAAAFQTQLRSEPTLGESLISGTTV